MELDFATVRKLTKVESLVYRDFNRHQAHELAAMEAVNDMDNRTAIAAALACLTRNGFGVSFNPTKPDRPKVEGKELSWEMLLSIVSLLREAEWAKDRAEDKLKAAILRWKDNPDRNRKPSAQDLIDAEARLVATRRRLQSVLR